MNIFLSLPHLERCCFCISLKVGSIIIAVIHMLFGIEAIFGGGAIGEFNKCYSQNLLMSILGYVAIVVAILVFVATLYFLYGVIVGDPFTAVWFMYASLLLLVFHIIAGVFLFFQTSTEDCPATYILGGGSIICSLMLFYFLIIIASYNRKMMYR